ncbi:hypothetical protein SteCoe_35045 [Stentor coeruleus]|uniref:Uncharacterized protein n=1 Tax=Stentor coeruleus TaxID=5963 RepID=A0A1R2AT70_9CILI|nr:hypothetical protein SteCoe_35045 [Stentor coeruleus]
MSLSIDKITENIKGLKLQSDRELNSSNFQQAHILLLEAYKLSMTYNLRMNHKNSGIYRRLAIVLLRICIYNGYNIAILKEAKSYSKLYIKIRNQKGKSLKDKFSFDSIYANYYIVSKKYLKAIQYFNAFKDHFISTLQLNDLNLALSYNSLGLAYTALSRNEEALDSFFKCIEILQKIARPDNYALISTYNSLAVLYSNMGRYSEAQEYYEKCRPEFEKNLQKDDINLATFYNNLGELYYNKNNLTKALEFYIIKLIAWKKLMIIIKNLRLLQRSI